VQRLSPRDPRGWYIAATFALAYFADGRYEEAISFSIRALQHNPRYAASLRVLAASLALLGQQDKAAEVLQRFRAVDPQATLSRLRERLAFMHDTVWNRLSEGLKKAGLPE
jgi:adenylate cyclase